MAGALLSFLSFDVYNRRISFFSRLYTIPIIMVFGFISLFLVGELVDKGGVKNGVFYVVIFLQGFVNETLQFTIVRYVFFWGWLSFLMGNWDCF